MDMPVPDYADIFSLTDSLTSTHLIRKITWSELALVLGTQRCLRPWLPGSISTKLLLAGVAYFVYLGKVNASITIKYVEILVMVVGAGTQTAEAGLFSPPSALNKAGQTLKINVPPVPYPTLHPWGWLEILPHSIKVYLLVPTFGQPSVPPWPPPSQPLPAWFMIIRRDLFLPSLPVVY